MISYDFTRHAERMFLKLPKTVQNQIIRKLEYYLAQPDPLAFASPLENAGSCCYRFRIGDYRVIFDREKSGILILAVGHRRDIYR